VAENMPMWVICKNPSDYPGKFTARLHIIDFDTKQSIPTKEMFVADTLDEARELIPQGLALIPRYPNDDPVIVETWI